METKKQKLDPRNDFVFKALFTQGSLESTIARNNLIEAFIGKKVHSSTVVNNELPVTNDEEKAITLDLHCILDDKTRVNIEMQFAKTPDSIESRISHYLMRLASLQKLKGKNYSEVRDVFVIFISDKTLYDDPEHLAHFRMTSKKGREICPELNIIILELQKLRKKAILKEDLNLAEKWGLFFSYAHDENKKNVLQQIIENEEGIHMANQVLEGITQEDIDSGIEFLKWQREYKKSVLIHAAQEEALAKGLEQGREEGLEQGREEGIEQGIEQGIYQEKVQTARNMKVEGFSSEQIERLTGLAEGEY